MRSDTKDADAGYHVFPKDRSFEASDGTPIAYTVRGDGSSGVSFVLVNGWSCSDVYWAELAPHLERRGHRVLISDTRGHGASGLPRRPGYRARNISADDMSLERVATDFHELCAHESVDRAVFAGHSMGVQVMLEAYRLRPDRFTGLLCVAGPYENPLKTFYGQRYTDHLFPVAKFALHAIPRFLLPAWRALGGQQKLGYRAALLSKAAGPKLTEKALAPYIEHFVTRDPIVMFKLVEAMRDSSAADLLPTVDVPMLILAGARDTFTPLSVQKRMHELTPTSELVIFDEGHHTLPLEEPEGINRAVDEFIERRVLPLVHPR